MSKGTNGNHSGQTQPKQFIGAGATPRAKARKDAAAEEAGAPAKAGAAAQTEGPDAQAQPRVQIEDRVEKIVATELRNDPPAVAADKLVEMAQADLLKREVLEAKLDQAHAEASRLDEKRTAAAPRSFKDRGVQLADDLVARAEKRLAALPEPVRRAGRLVEQGASMALWPVRFGLRLTGELLRTPIALARILLRSRTA